jgi:hypothetical protein
LLQELCHLREGARYARALQQRVDCALAVVHRHDGWMDGMMLLLLLLVLLLLLLLPPLRATDACLLLLQG